MSIVFAIVLLVLLYIFMLHSWWTLLSGDPGEPGDVGVRGEGGVIGKAGPGGLQGDDGPRGPPGQPGPQGEKGNIGDICKSRSLSSATTFVVANSIPPTLHLWGNWIRRHGK